MRCADQPTPNGWSCISTCSHRGAGLAPCGMLKPVMVDENEVDRDLLARVREGDDSAYGELFSRHADAIRRFSLRHVREAAEADDLTAEAFFRMLQAIRRGSGPTDHVRTYLLTVARRVAWEWSGRRRDVPVEDEELGLPRRAGERQREQPGRAQPHHQGFLQPARTLAGRAVARRGGGRTPRHRGTALRTLAERHVGVGPPCARGAACGVPAGPPRG